MAAKEVFTNPIKYGFRLRGEDLYPPVAVDWVEVKTPLSSLADFAKQQGINYMQLKDYNVWLRDTMLTTPRQGVKMYRIAVPKAADLYFDRKRVRVHDPAWVRE
jgi:hypothetical protein